MTNDSRLFPPRPQWEAKGYRPDEYSRWLLGDWRPIEELWEEMGVDPSRPEPAEIELEDWLFDTTAGPERREAETRFVHGHRLKPGDIERTDSHARCAQPPYDRLPIPRAALPPGLVLSREGDTWIREEAIRDAALPLYEGRMIGQSDFSQKGWVSGKGRSAVWRDIPWGRKQIEPQYLMAHEDYALAPASERGLKLTFMDVTSSTNVRTMIASIVPDLPCGNSAPVLNCPRDSQLLVCGILDSAVYDFALRARFSGLHANWFVIEESPLPVRNNVTATRPLGRLGQGLSLATQLAGPQWVLTHGGQDCSAWRFHWFMTDHARVRARAIMDAVIACLLGLSSADLDSILQSCDHPDASGYAKGFWRVDKDKAPELRHTVLALIAFQDLRAKIDAVDGDQERGVEAFLTQNDGEGWLLPETLRLADYGLGHDERAREPQPVASRLGPRFYDWQLVQSADESWRECHLHARNLLGEHGYALRVVDLIAQRMADDEDHRGLLTDPFTRDLAGDDGYVTVLTEIRARDLLYESAWWSLVGELRGAGHLDDDSFGRLLDRLHARELLSDADYRRRGGPALPATGADLPAQRVAETGPGGQPELFPTRRQRKLFE